MPPRLIVDPDRLDAGRVLRTREEIRRTVPQRFEMEQLTAIHHFDAGAGVAVASREVRPDEWWVKGHFPGRPILPGILIVESAAQLATWLFRELVEEDRLLGFGGLSDVRFRRAVVPPATLFLAARVKEIRSRRADFETQAVLDGQLVYEGLVRGMAV